MSYVTGFVFYDVLLWTFVGVLGLTALYFKSHSR